MLEYRRFKWHRVAVFVMAVVGLFFFNSCKDYLHVDYELNITIEEGTAGTPEAGTYTYEEFTKIDYMYHSLEPNVEIEVVLNGNRKEPIGTFIMYRDLDVVVRVIDMRGEWNVTFTKSGEDTKWVMTIAGDSPFLGTFSDDRGYHGTWTVTGNDLKITFTDWADYVFTGKLRDMKGTWTGEEKSGEWRAVKR